MTRPTQAALVLATALGALGFSDDLAEEGHPRLHNDVLWDEPVEHGRDPIDGRAFPDGVLALTWDDGPDVHTLELARWLAEQRVPSTFFVVGEWDKEVSSDPGVGREVYATGHRRIPILGDLVRLGHRLGNHTFDHALLSDTSIEGATEQLAREQAEIDLFLPVGALRMFRPPGGQWTDNAASALDDPRLAGMVGPIRWDIDGKDWECSLYCRSDAPRRECAHGRVRPEVVADRYLTRIERLRRGIVLMHDRVGDVGSRYALDLAKRLVPKLKARGYVFAAPVLGFSPLRRQEQPIADSHSLAGDLNGDGIRDECTITPLGTVSCALSNGRAFAQSTLWLDSRVDNAWLADVNHDGRADLCTRSADGTYCAYAP